MFIAYRIPNKLTILKLRSKTFDWNIHRVNIMKIFYFMLPILKSDTTVAVEI